MKKKNGSKGFATALIFSVFPELGVCRMVSGRFFPALAARRVVAGVFAVFSALPVRRLVPGAILVMGIIQWGLAEGGHDKKFFLSDSAGINSMYFEGQIQNRLLANFRDASENGAPKPDALEAGFQLRRAKIGLSGTVLSKDLKYKVKGGFERSGGVFALEEAYAQYALSKMLYLKTGQFKGRFMREELVSSSKQQAVERTGVNEFFTLDYSQGIEVGLSDKWWNAGALLHDGRESDGVDFDDDFTDVGLAGRVEIIPLGNAKQFKDFAAWSKEETAFMIGLGADFELSESELEGKTLDHFFQWTADLSLELMGFNLFGAVLGRNVTMLDTDRNAFQLGLQAQAGAFLIKDKLDVFGRWEFLQFDGLGEVSSATPGTTPVEDQQSISGGVNYYIKGHASKISLDVVFSPDGIVKGESGAGILDSDEAQTSVRTQYQLLF